jgi:hypothetical protein
MSAIEPTALAPPAATSTLADERMRELIERRDLSMGRSSRGGLLRRLLVPAA